jgi:putative membrane protein
MKSIPVFQRITSIILGLYALSTTLSILAVSGLLPVFLVPTPVNTLLAFIFGLLHASQRLGWRRAFMLVAVVFLTGLGFESFGVATGLLYGGYHYSDLLGAKFLDLVPYLIPIAWFMMIYPSFVMAERIAGRINRAWLRLLLVAGAGGVIMTAWDLGMDPLMVRGGNWVWDTPGAYFGIPVQNFLGWWLTTFFALLIYQLLAGRRANPSRYEIPDSWVVWLYAITGLSTVIVDAILGLPGPALVGLFAMLPWVTVFFLS